MTAISARPTATPEPLSVCTCAHRAPFLGAVARAHAPRLETRRTPSRTKSRDTCSGPAARPRCRRSFATRSPCRRRTASSRGSAGSSRRSISSAQESMRSCSSLLCSGVVIETSSTLVNWCWRIMPRVSLPAAPASARKHGVQRGEPQRQLGFFEDRLAREIGERDFGGRNEPVVRSSCGTDPRRISAIAPCQT